MSDLSKREIQRNKTENLMLELLLIRSILFKFGQDHIAENESSFVAFVNAMDNPPRTTTGAELTYMGFRQLMSRFPRDRMQYLYDKITSEPIAISLE